LTIRLIHRYFPPEKPTPDEPIDESKDDAAPRTLDLAGAATATLGLASLIYAISEAPKNGWASPATFGTAGMGTVLLGVFVAHERRASTPLVALPILYRRAVAVPNLAVVLGFAAVGAVIAAATATGPVGVDALLSGLRWGLWSATAFAVLALMLVVVSMGSSSRRQPEI
jgi:hypothetical protein